MAWIVPITGGSLAAGVSLGAKDGFKLCPPKFVYEKRHPFLDAFNQTCSVIPDYVRSFEEMQVF